METINFFSLILKKLKVPFLLIIISFSISVLGLILIPGIDSDGNEYHLSIFHAFYITVYTSLTIGYGEIPYVWTDIQRMWMIVVSFLTVASWLIGFGSIINILKDESVKIAINKLLMEKKIRSQKEKFFIVVGFGNKGESIVDYLNMHNIPTYIIDKNHENTDKLKFKNYGDLANWMHVDDYDTETLERTGIDHEQCKGVIVTIDDNSEKINISLTCKILNPKLKVITTTYEEKTKRNLLSFGTNYVVMPDKLFAEYIELAINEDPIYDIYHLLTSENSFSYSKIQPPKGKWIIVGYNTLSQTVINKLKDHNEIEITLITNKMGSKKNVEQKFNSYGLEEKDLIEAGISDAVCILATRDDDMMNLSTLITAKNLNKNVYTISKQNSHINDKLFEKAGIDHLIKPYEIVSRNIHSYITEPLLKDFLRIVQKQRKTEISEIHSNIDDIYQQEDNIETWSVKITEKHAPGAYYFLKDHKATIECLIKNDYNLKCTPLLLKRGKEKIIKPKNCMEVLEGDEILFAGPHKLKTSMDWGINNYKTMYYRNISRDI